MVLMFVSFLFLQNWRDLRETVEKIKWQRKYL